MAARRHDRSLVGDGRAGRIHSAGGRTLAQAGSLPGPAAEEVQLALARAGGQDRRSDLVRYLDLTSTRSDGLLYATPLAAGQALGLFFNKETSVRQARTITQLVAQAIGRCLFLSNAAGRARTGSAARWSQVKACGWAEDEERRRTSVELNLKDCWRRTPARSAAETALKSGWQRNTNFNSPGSNRRPSAVALADTSPLPTRRSGRPGRRAAQRQQRQA
jgi:hypothetical protein